MGRRDLARLVELKLRRPSGGAVPMLRSVLSLRSMATCFLLQVEWVRRGGEVTLADIQRAGSDAERSLETLLKWNGITGWEREYRFAPPRRWRLDFVWSKHALAVEVEGGSWVGGRHTRGPGFERDLEKYNEAAILGWNVLRVTPKLIR